MTDYNEKLIDIRYRMKEKERLQGVTEKLRASAKALEDKKRELQEALKKEELDVEKIEGLSIAALVHLIKGDREEQIEREREEAFSAKMKYDSVCAELTSINTDMENIRERIIGFGDLEKEYSGIINEKEKHLNPETAGMLGRIIEEQARQKSMEKEVREARDAGYAVLGALDNIKKSLDSAAGWGTWDMLGGGLISTMAKHSRLDDAKSEIDRAQWLMKRFHRELSDLGGSLDVNIEIGSFMTFADYFFDGFFVDWAVQSRIHDAQNQVSNASMRVGSLLGRLDNELRNIDAKMQDLKKQRIDIIERD